MSDLFSEGRIPRARKHRETTGGARRKPQFPGSRSASLSHAPVRAGSFGFSRIVRDRGAEGRIPVPDLDIIVVVRIIFSTNWLPIAPRFLRLIHV